MQLCFALATEVVKKSEKKQVQNSLLSVEVPGSESTVTEQ